MMLLLLLGFAVIYIAYFVSAKVSELMRKNQELAMQMSLVQKPDILRNLTDHLPLPHKHIKRNLVLAGVWQGFCCGLPCGIGISALRG